MRFFLKQFAWCLLASATLLPTAVFAAHQAGHVDPAPQAQGPSVFDCGGNGLEAGYYSVIEATYVPVSDMAITRNTSNFTDSINKLVYKECVIDVIATRQADAILVAKTKSIIEQANAGRGGAPQYVSNPPLELKNRGSEAVAEFIKKYNIDNVCAPFREQAKVALARQYMATANDPNNSVRCTSALSGADHEAFLRGDTARGGMTGLWDLFVKGNNDPYGATKSLQARAAQDALQKQASLLAQWDWGNGFYPQEEQRREPTESGDERVTRYTVTPAYITSRMVEQAVTSGLRRTENSDEIGEVAAATFTGLTDQVMSSPQGMAGLSQTQGGGISFLEQLANLAVGQLRDTVTDTALARVRSAIATEQAFAAKKTETKGILVNTANSLKSAEDQCWAQMVPAVQTLAAQGNCVTVPGAAPPFGGLPGAGVTTCTPIPLAISTSTQKITGGTGTVTLAQGIAIPSGSAFSVSASQTTLIQSAVLAMNARIATTTAGQTISFALSASAGSFGPGGSVTLATQATPLFNSGTFATKLAAGQRFSIGNAQISLAAFSPFTQAVINLTVELARRFADPIIAEQVTPLIQQVDQDLVDSANGIALLRDIEADLLQRDTPDVQRAALERLENLLSTDAIHSQRDAQNAELQRAQVTGATQTLLTDTQTTWTTGGNWCNTGNPNVVQEWLNQWKI